MRSLKYNALEEFQIDNTINSVFEIKRIMYVFANFINFILNILYLYYISTKKLLTRFLILLYFLIVNKSEFDTKFFHLRI